MSIIKQKIIIVHSKKYEFIEKFSLILHILTLMVSFLTLVSIFFSKDHASTSILLFDKILESITMIFVSIIIFIHLFQPILKRSIVKKYLIDFWEEREIRTVLSHPEKIDYNKKGEMGKIIKQIDEEFIYLTKTYFKRKHFRTSLVIKRTKKINDKPNSKFTPFTIIPSYIIVDIKEGKIEMTNKVTIINGEKIDSPRHLYFDYVNKTVNWSGQFPEVPYYGTWEW